MARNDSSGVRYKNCLSDGTSFMFNIKTERNGAGYYEGYDSYGQNVAVQIKGQPIYTDDTDTY